MAGLSSRTGRFIYVYRLAIDARPKWGDGVTGRKCPSLLEDFQTGVAYRCGSRGAYFLLPKAAILFSGGLEGPTGRTGSYGIGLLPRLVLSRDL